MELPVTVTRMSPEREHALVALARPDGTAFGELYDSYLPVIYGFIDRALRAVRGAMAEGTTDAA